MADKEVDPDKVLSTVNATRTRRKAAPSEVETSEQLFGELFGDAIITATTTWTTTTTTTTTTTYDAETGLPRRRLVNMRKEYNFPLNIRALDQTD